MAQYAGELFQAGVEAQAEVVKCDGRLFSALRGGDYFRRYGRSRGCVGFLLRAPSASNRDMRVKDAPARPRSALPEAAGLGCRAVGAAGAVTITTIDRPGQQWQARLVDVAGAPHAGVPGTWGAAQPPALNPSSVTITGATAGTWYGQIRLVRDTTLIGTSNAATVT